MKKIILVLCLLASANLCLAQDLTLSLVKQSIAGFLNSNFGIKLADFKLDEKRKNPIDPQNQNVSSWKIDGKISNGIYKNSVAILNKVEDFVKSTKSDQIKFMPEIRDLNEYIFLELIPYFKGKFESKKILSKQDLSLLGSDVNKKYQDVLKKINDLGKSITDINAYNSGPKEAQDILRFLLGGPAKKMKIGKNLEAVEGVYKKLLDKIVNDFEFREYIK